MVQVTSRGGSKTASPGMLQLEVNDQGCLKGDMCPPEKLKNALFFSNEILGILISIPPTFPISYSVARTIIDPLGAPSILVTNFLVKSPTKSPISNH